MAVRGGWYGRERVGGCWGLLGDRGEGIGRFGIVVVELGIGRYTGMHVYSCVHIPRYTLCSYTCIHT